MKNKIQTFAIVAISIFFLLSCSKGKVEPESKTKTELLTKGSWKLASWTSNPAYDWDQDGQLDPTDYLSQLENCEKDDLITFKTNKDLVIDLKTFCDYEEGPQTETIKWDFANNESNLLLKYDETDIETYQISELTETKLRIKETYTHEGISFTDEITYVH